MDQEIKIKYVSTQTQIKALIILGIFLCGLKYIELRVPYILISAYNL